MSVPPRTRASLAVLEERSFAAREVALPVQKFIHTEGVSGFFLLGAAVIALIWANSPWQASYFQLWEAKVSLQWAGWQLSKSLHHWINDGLMSLFFFVVGMEIKHELVHGALADRKQALLPLSAALGGMIVPAFFYYVLNAGEASVRGWGIPMATDIAFALAVIGLLKGVPPELKVFLLALAIVDDIGAILVIALFYTAKLSLLPFAGAVACFGLVLLLKQFRVRSLLPFATVGLLAWLLVLFSGIHATIAGVVLGMMVSSAPLFSRDVFNAEVDPLLSRFRDALAKGDEQRADAVLGAIETMAAETEARVERLTRQLHGWVAYGVLPLFALANAGVRLDSEALRTAVSSMISWGVVLGLVVGKPLGIFAFAWASVRGGWAALPVGVNWIQVAAVGALAGIGFTVSIFVADLAFEEVAPLAVAKIAVLTGSLLSAALGYAALRFTTFRA